MRHLYLYPVGIIQKRSEARLQPCKNPTFVVPTLPLSGNFSPAVVPAKAGTQ